MERSCKAMVSVLLGILMSFDRKYSVLTILVGGAILLDLITGIRKSKISHTLNSNKGFVGFWKKISLLVALAFGFFLDFLEFYLLTINSDIILQFQISFGIIIGIYIIINENISIIENLSACGVKIPQFILTTLKSYNETIEKNKHKNKK